MSGSRYGSNRVKWIQRVEKQEDLHSVHFGVELAWIKRQVDEELNR